MRCVARWHLEKPSRTLEVAFVRGERRMSSSKFCSGLDIGGTSGDATAYLMGWPAAPTPNPGDLIRPRGGGRGVFPLRALPTTMHEMVWRPLLYSNLVKQKVSSTSYDCLRIFSSSQRSSFTHLVAHPSSSSLLLAPAFSCSVPYPFAFSPLLLSTDEHCFSSFDIAISSALPFVSPYEHGLPGVDSPVSWYILIDHSANLF